MFGLMKPIRSVEGEEQWMKRRFQYCGTCKTISSLYGNKMRLALNSDAVFLGELLGAISGNDEKAEYPSAYKSINCFALPNSDEELPLSFQYAATVNTLLAEVKIDDHINDSVPFLWILLRKYLSTGFRRATKKLKSWDFPISELWMWVAEQKRRENALVKLLEKKKTAPTSILEYLAEPTAQMTAIAFAQGARP